MDYEQVERNFRKLSRQHDRGELAEDQFRVEVAKLMFQDSRGIFWMIDADDGTWYCNRGEAWEPGDPRAEQVVEVARPPAKRRRRGLALGAALIVLAALVGVMVYLQQPAVLWNLLQPAPAQEQQVKVTIASPADGSKVPLGQVVAVESTINAATGLGSIDRVELQVDGQRIDAQTVQPKIQPGQNSLPLSLAWRPVATGDYQVAVAALSTGGSPLGSASIALHVTESSGEALPEPVCTPDAAFLTDVTIPPGSAFPPGARMDKVWQVRNKGTCAWGMGYELVLVAGEGLGAPSTIPVPPTAAGETADLAVTFWAPADAGSYASVWQLESPDGEFFGPTMTLSIEVEILAEESLPPEAPGSLQASVSEDGKAVRLTWEDRSDNEDAFRIYREDVEASIGLAPADAGSFVDEGVACGNTYRYSVVAFNAAGTSPLSEPAEATLPDCAPADAPPTLSLTVVPTQVIASQTFTVAFEAYDDLELVQVLIWGEETGDPALDDGRVFVCTGASCSGSWPVTLELSPGLTSEISATLAIAAAARDSLGQESEPARIVVIVLPAE
jgi:hypothetical protein